SFSLYQVYGSEELNRVALNELPYIPAGTGKWTDLLLGNRQRQLFRRVVSEHFIGLGDYGAPELGTVTGANAYFVISDTARLEAGLEDQHVQRICPPGSRHLKGLSFTGGDWNALRDAGEDVWLVCPPADDTSVALLRYIERGVADGVHEAYK